MNTILKHLIYSTALVILAIFVYPFLLNSIVATFQESNTIITSTNLSGHFIDFLIFCVAIGIIPILKMLVDCIVKKSHLKQSILTYIFILFFGALVVTIRLYIIKNDVDQVNFGIINQIPFEKIKIGIYALIGAIIGFLISLVCAKFLLKMKK